MSREESFSDRRSRPNVQAHDSRAPSAGRTISRPASAVRNRHVRNVAIPCHRDYVFRHAFPCAWRLYRYLYADAFEKASEKLNWQIGSLNTLVLLVSSLMMVLAVHYARLGLNRQVVYFLLFTAFLGMVFLVLKGVEYYDDYRQNLIPGWRFDANEWIKQDGLSAAQVGQVKIFLLMYWIMTVTHAVHMTIGITAVLILAALALAELFRSRLLRPYRCDRPLLALRRHRLDLFAADVVPARHALAPLTGLFPPRMDLPVQNPFTNFGASANS